MNRFAVTTGNGTVRPRQRVAYRGLRRYGQAMRRRCFHRILTATVAAAMVCGGLAPAFADQAELNRIAEDAAGLDRLKTLMVSLNGETMVARAYGGPGLSVPVSIKSVAKTIISTLAGIAVDKGVLEGPEQRVAALLADQFPADPDPRLRELTIGHLLSMRAGLQRTSGEHYGAWVSSANWVRYVLSRPFVDDPGGEMIYSTGNSHLVSAILTRASGRSTWELAQAWLAEPLNIRIPHWQRDPHGIYMGGNNMALSSKALLAIGEMYRRGGTSADGERVLSEAWIEASWTPKARSPYSGDQYGYGWFITEVDGSSAYYARGFGGQFLYVMPARGLTMVITSDDDVRTRVDGYWNDLRRLITGIVAAVKDVDASPSSSPDFLPGFAP